MEKTNKKMALLALFVAMGSSLGYSQVSALEKPAANLTEKWDLNSSGWVANDPLCGWTNGTLAIKCQLQSLGDGLGKILSLAAAPGASSGIFFGNYSKIENVTFDLQPYGMTVSPSFYFKSAVSGMQWSFPFLPQYVDGQKLSITIPLTYSTNWLGYRGDDASVRFNNDKTNIYEVGIEFYRGPNDLKAQQFAVDNMKLVGPWGGPFSNGVSLAWVLENGLTNNDFSVVGLLDSDNDGYSNAAEFLAGTNPNDSNSYFKIEIGRNNAGQMVVKWNGNRDVNYELREANSLGTDGAFVSKTNIIPAAVQSEEVAVDQNDSNSKFFKVLITPIK